MDYTFAGQGNKINVEDLMQNLKSPRTLNSNILEIPDFPEKIGEFELESGGVISKLESSFSKSVGALEKAFKDNLKILRQNFKK